MTLIEDRQQRESGSIAMSAGPWRIETIDSHAGMILRRNEWLALERCCIDPQAAFQGFSWCECWARLYCGDDNTCRPLIQMIHRGDALVAIVPLMLTARWGIKTLTLFGEPHSQLANAIADPTVDCGEGIRLALDMARTESKADIVALGPIAHGTVLVQVFGAQELRRDPAGETSVVTWPGIGRVEDYVAALPKNRRKDFRKKLRRLEEFGAVSFERHDPGDVEFPRLAKQALSWKLGWLARSGLISAGLECRDVEKFLCGFKPGNGGYHLEAEALCVSGRPIAICLNLVGKNVRHCYLSAYDEAYAGVSAGTLIHQFAIQASIENGFLAYSFLGYPTPFKRMWANDAVPLMGFQKAVTSRGKLWLGVWVNGLRPLIKKFLLQWPAVLSARPVRSTINTLRILFSSGSGSKRPPEQHSGKSHDH